MTTADTFEARDLSRIANRHHELRGPARPRFVRDLLCVPLGGDGLYILGGEPQVLHGQSVRWLLNDLVPLLDGTRTATDLEAAFPDLAASDVRDALAFLHMHGMVEDAEGDGEGARGESMPESQIFFSRYLRRTGRRRSGREAQEALEAARIVVLGDERLAGILALSLRELGVSGIDVESIPDAVPLTGVDLVVAFGTASTLERASRHCAAARVPLLAVNPEAWAIGPLTIPRASACYVCATLQMERAAPPRSIPHQALRELWRRALVSRVAQHVVAFATGLVQALPLELIEVWLPLERTTRLQSVTRLPNCPACGTVAPPLTMTLPSGRQESRARLFHNSSAVQPWHLQQPAGMQQHITPHVQRLQDALVDASSNATAGRSARIASAPATSVLARRPAVALGALPPAVPPAALDDDLLNALLFYSFGGRVDRRGDATALHLHTASAGNLASAEAFVACLRVRGLAAGIYRYVLATNTLQLVGTATAAAALIDAARPLTTDGKEPTPPDVVLAIVSSVARVCGKYFGRGYTYALLDAGVMSHRVEVVAQELGFSAHTAWQFDDAAVTASLEVDGIDVCPHVLVGLGGSHPVGVSS